MNMSSCLRVLVIASVVTALFGASNAADIVVGSPNGSWDLSTNYKAWAAKQTFRVGDNLVFRYDSSHDVLEVTKSNYDSCGTSNPIKTSTGGNTVVPLSSAGPKYFICGTPGHCAGGMKLEVNVVAGGPTTPPTGASSGPTMSPPSESGAADGLSRGMVAAGVGLGMLVALAI